MNSELVISLYIDKNHHSILKEYKEIKEQNFYDSKMIQQFVFYSTIYDENEEIFQDMIQFNSSLINYEGFMLLIAQKNENFINKLGKSLIEKLDIKSKKIITIVLLKSNLESILWDFIEDKKLEIDNAFITQILINPRIELFEKCYQLNSSRTIQCLNKAISNQNIFQQIPADIQTYIKNLILNDRLKSNIKIQNNSLEKKKI